MIFKAAADTLGRQPGGTGAGPGGICVCPVCGYTEKHELGEACNQTKCSECGATMARKSEVEEDSIAKAEFDALSHTEKIDLYHELCDKSLAEIMEDPELVEKAVWATAYKKEKGEIIEDENTQVDQATEVESMDIEAEKVSLVSRLLDFLRIGKAEDEQATPEEPKESAEKAEEVTEQPIVVQIPDEVTALITNMGERLAALEKATEPAKEVVEEPAEEVVEAPTEKAEEVAEEVVAEEPVEEVVEEAAEKSEEEAFALINANFEAVYAKMDAQEKEKGELEQANAALTEQLAAVASSKGISTQVPASVGKAQTTQDENIKDHMANPKNWHAGQAPRYVGP